MAGRGLPFELFLALRYLRARGQRANLSLFVWIGVGGVFLGVSALIVVLAVMTGFQDGIKDRMIAANPHILVLDPGGRGVSGAVEVASRVRALRGVLSATPFVVQQALFTGPGRRAPGSSSRPRSRREASTPCCAPRGGQPSCWDASSRGRWAWFPATT